MRPPGSGYRLRALAGHQPQASGAPRPAAQQERALMQGRGLCSASRNGWTMLAVTARRRFTRPRWLRMEPSTDRSLPE